MSGFWPGLLRARKQLHHHLERGDAVRIGRLETGIAFFEGHDANRGDPKAGSRPLPERGHRWRVAHPPGLAGEVGGVEGMVEWPIYAPCIVGLYLDAEDLPSAVVAPMAGVGWKLIGEPGQ